MVTKNTFHNLIYNYLFKAINAIFLSILNDSVNERFCLRVFLKNKKISIFYKLDW